MKVKQWNMVSAKDGIDEILLLHARPYIPALVLRIYLEKFVSPQIKDLLDGPVLRRCFHQFGLVTSVTRVPDRAQYSDSASIRKQAVQLFADRMLSGATVRGRHCLGCQNVVDAVAECTARHHNSDQDPSPRKHDRCTIYDGVPVSHSIEYVSIVGWWLYAASIVRGRGSDLGIDFAPVSPNRQCNVLYGLRINETDSGS